MRTLLIVSVFLSAPWLTVGAAAQSDLSEAKTQYEEAAYEDALTTLTKASASTPADRVQLEQYRALCLIALGRLPEAERAVAALVDADPMYVPPTSVASPRVLAMVAEIRRKELPGVTRRVLDSGRAAYEAKNFSLAQRHVRAADTGQRGTHADPVLGPQCGWVVSAQLQPRHPTPGHAWQAIPEQLQRSLVDGRRAEAQPQAARRSGHLLESSQSIGTRRTILGPTRSRISSRLSPVMVRPWFFRPMTARAGSGACRTSSATSIASSSVPHGYTTSVEIAPAIQPWTCRMPPTSGCSR